VWELERDAMLAAADVHWWHRGRRRIVEAELDGLAIPAGSSLLDAGCGAGSVLDLLSRYGQAVGVDPDTRSVELTRARGHEAVVAGLPALPFDDATFAVTTCLDVLEHLEDDGAALAELERVTARDGALLVTVPAYQTLWSSHDVANEHVRRYNARRLRRVAAAARLQVERITYFNSLLLPPAAAVRLAERVRRRPRRPGVSDLDLTPRAVNGLLELPLRLEAAWLRSGARLPAGLSLLAVLRRPPRP
jgi:SAM-dependent methyltransferase